MADTGLHGISVDGKLAEKVLDLTNKLRYGVGEAERMDLIQRERIPGIRDAAYPGEQKIYDPAAAERYGSAYLFAQKWPALSGVAEPVTKAFRGAGHALGVPGMGPERKELEVAQRLGILRGKLAGLGAGEIKRKETTPMANPWDDPSLASPETKKLQEANERIKREGLNPKPKNMTAPAPKLSKLSDAYGQAEKLEKRNKKIELATRGVRRALPGQGQ
jgi:hypothetical protein